MEDRHEQQDHGPREVDQAAKPGMGQDGGGVAQVGQHDARGAAPGQQRVRMDVDDRVLEQSDSRMHYIGSPGAAAKSSGNEKQSRELD